MSDHLEDVRVTPSRIIEPRSIDERNLAPIEPEGWCDLNDVRTGAQSSADSHLGATDGVDKLQ
jgi:hypothetical protein